jgi:hypothetical protein
MVPSEYRLEQVAARLIERLEGTRRSYVEDPAGAAQAFAVIAGQVVEDAIGEMTHEQYADDPRRQADLLRAEVERTFLPRYTRLATTMTAREEAGYGAGLLYGPLGRLGMLAVGLLLAWLWLRVPGAWGAAKLAPLLMIPALMVVPDVMAALVRRTYRVDLEGLVQDLRRIQDRARDYEPTSDAEHREAPPTARRAAASERGVVR